MPAKIREQVVNLSQMRSYATILNKSVLELNVVQMSIEFVKANLVTESYSLRMIWIHPKATYLSESGPFR